MKHLVKTIPIGSKFNRLTVVGKAPKHPDGRAHWLCVCDCGCEVAVIGKNLRTGNSQSCGCLKKELTIARETTHGLSKTVIDHAWKGAVARCYRTTHPKFPRYGARGIKVCEFLRSSPANLLMLVGVKPTSEHSLGRMDNDGNYSCGSCAECCQREWPMNVRWETRLQQARNRGNTLSLTRNGVTKPIAEWAEELGIARGVIAARMHRGSDPFKV